MVLVKYGHFVLSCFIYLFLGSHAFLFFFSDFGLSRLIHSNRLDTMTNMTGQVGTPAFLAPELVMTISARAGKKVDVYSFGILLCCMCSRTMPYAEYMDMSCYQV